MFCTQSINTHFIDFIKMRKPKVDYEFRIENDTDYIMGFELEAKDKAIVNIFNKSVTKLKRKHNLDVKENPENIDQFEVPDEYRGFLKVAIKKLYVEVHNEVKKDGIITLNYYVYSAKFKRKQDKSKDWDIYIRVGGQYADRR